jgi:3-oxoacyl-[acyl-carrier-protein] synthase II
MSKRRVVVTGMGIVSPLGNDLASSWDGIVNGRSGIGPVTPSMPAPIHAHRRRDPRLRSPLGEPEGREEDGPFIHYGVAASLMAMEDSGLEVTEANAERIGALIGSGIGGIWASRRPR